MHVDPFSNRETCSSTMTILALRLLEVRGLGSLPSQHTSKQRLRKGKPAISNSLASEEQDSQQVMESETLKPILLSGPFSELTHTRTRHFGDKGDFWRRLGLTGLPKLLLGSLDPGWCIEIKAVFIGLLLRRALQFRRRVLIGSCNCASRLPGV